MRYIELEASNAFQIKVEKSLKTVDEEPYVFIISYRNPTQAARL